MGTLIGCAIGGVGAIGGVVATMATGAAVAAASYYASQAIGGTLGAIVGIVVGIGVNGAVSGAVSGIKAYIDGTGELGGILSGAIKGASDAYVGAYNVIKATVVNLYNSAVNIYHSIVDAFTSWQIMLDADGSFAYYYKISSDGTELFMSSEDKITFIRPPDENGISVCGYITGDEMVTYNADQTTTIRDYNNGTNTWVSPDQQTRITYNSNNEMIVGSYDGGNTITDLQTGQVIYESAGKSNIGETLRINGNNYDYIGNGQYASSTTSETLSLVGEEGKFTIANSQGAIVNTGEVKEDGQVWLLTKGDATGEIYTNVSDGDWKGFLNIRPTGGGNIIADPSGEVLINTDMQHEVNLSTIKGQINDIKNDIASSTSSTTPSTPKKVSSVTISRSVEENKFYNSDWGNKNDPFDPSKALNQLNSQPITIDDTAENVINGLKGISTQSTPNAPITIPGSTDTQSISDMLRITSSIPDLNIPANVPPNTPWITNPPVTPTPQTPVQDPDMTAAGF